MITKTVKLLARLSLIPAIMIALLIDSSVNGTIMHIDWLSCIPSLDSFQATLLGATITSYSLFFAVISFISNHFNEDIYGITFQEIYEECYHNASLEYVKKVLVISSFASFFFIFINYLITAVTIFAYVFYQQCKIMLASNLLINEKKKFKVIGCLVTKELIKNRRLD
ncbi:MAG TPA: hypothetical protein VN131_05445, partial [Mobilitalea sp.]|nr:hypothetical protein [Mobilitalea sp.]